MGSDMGAMDDDRAGGAWMSRGHRWVDGGADGRAVEFCGLLYVGWESVEVHDAYRHTKHFRDRVVILREHNTGHREYGYGHLVFAHSRTRPLASL